MNRILLSVLLLGAAVMSHAANGYIDTTHYHICPGDTLTLHLKHKVQVVRDSVLFDTVTVLYPTEDSIHMYVVNQYPSFRQVEHREIVMGQTFPWHGQTIQQAGTYTKVYKTVKGCDSTYVLVVTPKEGVQIVLYSEETIPFCESITWNGHTYHESFVVVDTLHSTLYNCDSIVTRYFNQGLPFHHYETAYLYAGETLHWHGKTISDPGYYYDQHLNQFGCDSIYRLYVILRSPAHSYQVQSTRESICEGESFFWRGKERTLNGTYYDTVKIDTKIDTLFVLYLTVNPRYEYNETVSFSSFPTYYRGQNITQPGIYPVHYTSSTGCDSIINVIVNRQAIIHEETATICEGENYVWRYKRLTEAQTYTETVKGKDGKDSVTYILHLNVLPVALTRVSHTICQGDSYVFGNQVLTEAGEYRHTFREEGCDSVVILSLNVADVDTIVQVHRLNEGESYTWPANGHTYSTAGTYQVTKTNRFGCDSLVRLVLTIHHVDTIDTVATICPGETMVWHSISAKQTGHYENAETDPHGEMSYYRLDLTVLSQHEEERAFSICGDEAIVFNGKSYDKAGHYYDKGSCDTLYHIIVSQAPTQVYETNARLDGVNPYTWTYWHDGTEHTKNFSTPGTYEFTSPNADGCRDTWRLVLSLDDNSYHFVEKVTLCEGEPFSWRGHDDLSLVPGTAVYTEHLYTRTGQDSIYELQVTVLPLAHGNRTIHFCGSTEWKGVTYFASTIVYDTLTAANGCDSIIEISLRKTEGFFRRDTATIVQGEKMLWHGQTITTDGVYEDRQTNQYGCDSIYELHVGLKPATPQTNMITTIAEICEGDYYEWRGTKYYNTGNYPDTVYATSLLEKDTIYVLKLNVTEVDRRREQYSFCENEKLERIYGKDYNAKARTDSVYRDTVEVINPEHPGCPDIVYLEIYKYPVKRHTETQILHPGDTILWNEQIITRGGDYMQRTADTGLGGCDSISILHVVADLREEAFVCMIDTPDLYPYVWREDTFYTSGIWFDTVFTAEGDIREFHSLDLTITQPYDTAIYLHGCMNKGVVWRDHLYLADTTFIDRVPTIPYTPKNPCDSVFHVTIKMDTVYQIRIDTTLCEYQLPLIIGRINPDTIWSERDFKHISDTTSCGCDSIIEGHLTIIPSLERDDSTFVCSDVIKRHPVILGNTTHPAFLDNDGDKWVGKWEGKWTGVAYSEDTIVWDCDHRYFHHVFVRPSQRVIPEKNFFLCPDDSIQLFWPYDTTWFHSDTIYYERRPMSSSWTDRKHGNTFYDDSLTCDSITRWNIKVLPRRDRESTKHILLGDSLLWAGIWRHHTGDYDTIMPSQDTNSLGDTCLYVHTLHLIVDTAYTFRDTITLCEHAGKTINHTWADTHVISFNTPGKDTTFHVIQTLRTHSTLSLDSIYDLFVDFRKIRTSERYDTICAGDSLQFDRHWFGINNNQTQIQFLKEAGDYRDTITAINGCDSIITLHLFVRDLIPTTTQTLHIADTQAPYAWRHRWTDEDGHVIDSTRLLIASGTYTCQMKSIHGCDSTDILTLYIHPTYNIQDEEINICQNETPYTWRGLTNISETGDYTFHALTTAGFDSTHHVHINVWPQQYTNLYLKTCRGESLIYNGKTYTQPGIYKDTLFTRHGCDSILTIHFEWNEHYFYHTTARISDREKYRWLVGCNTHILTQSGTYYDTLQTVNGCDSVMALTLTVYPTYLMRDTAIVCAHSGLTMHHTWADGHMMSFNTPDEDTTFHLIDSLHTKTVLTLDSIYDLFVDYRKIRTSELYDTICAGDSLPFHRHWFGINDNQTEWQYIKEPGIYRDTVLAANGCDSIITMHLYVRGLIPPTSQTVHIPDTQAPYIWHHSWTGEDGQTIDSTRLLVASGTYTCQMKSSFGCDSTDILTLYIHPTYNIQDDEINICQNETPYTWRGLNNITETGDYTFHALTTAGFDSTHHVHINVWPQQYSDYFYKNCRGDSLVFNGKTYTQPGVYTDTLLTRHGCDSIITIHYEWYEHYYFHTSASISDQEQYRWVVGCDTHILTSAGTYYDTLQTVNGCDSVIALTLNVYPTYLFEERATICQDETPYIWHGRQYWTTGTYTDSMLTVHLYDSVYRLSLVVHDTFHVDHHFAICQGESFVYNGKTYSRGGIYMDTLTASTGCDSIVTIRVKETPHYFFSDTAAQANRQPYFWRGQLLTHTGIYRDSLTASTGCDSIYQLVLTIYDKEVLRDTTIRVCQNDLPVRWKQRWLSETGVYYDTITTHDVDTIWRVALTVIPMEHELIEKTLCEGDFYSFNGHIYTRDTLVHDTAFSGYGCGKEYTLYLHFRPAQVIDLYATTSSNVPYVWNVENTSYTYGYAGTYQHVVPSANGLCDSLRYVLHLTVGAVYEFRDSIKLCQSELPYIWHNQMIYEAGIYHDSLQTHLGYDSVYTLKVLQIMPSYYGEQSINLCAGASAFYYRGKPYNTDGIFYDTIPSVDGCDSIYKITVRVLPTYEIYDTVNISDKETYTFDGRVLDVPGPYVAYKKTLSGCDSIIHLQLYVHPSYYIEQEEEICEKDTILWHGQRLYKEGIYYDSLLTVQGYDSVYKMHLIVHKSYYFQESVEVCQGITTYLHGINISEPGVYLDTLYTIYGCDSIYKITVNWTRSFRQEFADTICQGEGYDFFGVTYYRSGTFKYQIGCDSIITLHLTVRPNSIEEKRVVIAEEDLPYRYDGQEFRETKVYEDTLQNRYGCDSIFKLNLIVSQHASKWYQMPLCPGSEIKIGGDVITKAGLYTFLRRSEMSGLMDSLYRVEVYDAPAYDLPTETRIICQGDTIEYAGHKLWRGGHYDFKLKTTEGCDSLLHMDLTVYPTYQFFTDATINDYQTYLWRGKEYDRQGEYNITYPTIHDCDSTYTLRLTVIPTQRLLTTDTICEGNTYSWRGKVYSIEGMYNDTVYLPQNGYSAIFTLQLTVLHPTNILTATVGDICADERTFDISFTYTGAQPRAYSIYFDHLAKDEGFVDVINQPFLGEDRVARADVPTKPEVVYREHTKYVKPNVYTMSLVLDNGVCGRSSIDSIELFVKYPNWIIEQSWNDVVIPLKALYNGGYEFSQIDWYVNEVKQANNGLGYLQSSRLKEGDQVVLYATRKGESYALPSCPLTIHINPSLSYDDPILVYPTQTPRFSPKVTIQAPQAGVYEVYNATGLLLFDGTLEPGETSVTLPYTSGIYFIRIHQGDELSSHKILVY